MTLWGAATAALMVVAALVAFVPMIPGPALVWAIGFIYAVATEFSEVSIAAAAWMTVFMIIGSTSDWWTRLLGLGAEGTLTCGTFAVSTIGAIVGTIAIPIPVLGTIIGAGAGVAALVFYQEENWEAALKAARGIMTAWLASFFVEIIVSITIITIFIRSLLNAWGMLGV